MSWKSTKAISGSTQRIDAFDDPDQAWFSILGVSIYEQPNQRPLNGFEKGATLPEWDDRAEYSIQKGSGIAHVEDMDRF
jgi:hypothetical protein